MKKLLISLLMILVLSSQVYANIIDKYIKKSGLDKKSNISVYVRNIDNDKVLYKKNEQKLFNPASTIKTLTFGASYYTLGKDYKFETLLYKNNNDIYVKLGGDTLLTEKDLEKLFTSFKKDYPNFIPDNVYVDDSIIESSVYPKSWMAADMWPHQRIITPYIIDNNYHKIAIKRSSLSTKVDVIQNDDYKLPIVNELKLGDKQDIKLERKYGNESSIVNIQGTVLEDTTINLPVLNPETNFKIKVNNALNKNKILYSKDIITKKTPETALKVACVEHTLKQISKNILHNSDNFTAEVVFKVAGAKYINYQKPATFEDSLLMFNEIFKNQISNDIKIVDASGLSRYDLVNANFMSEAFLELYSDEELKKLLQTSNQGTLANRLLFLKDNLRAKTGTLTNTSSIIGVMTTRKNKHIMFDIMIQNSPNRRAILKNFENTLIGLLYKKY